MANEADQNFNTEEAAVDTGINAEAEVYGNTAGNYGQGIAEKRNAYSDSAEYIEPQVENYAREAYEHKSSLTDQQIKDLSKKKISKGELKRQSVLLIISAIFVAYGLLFYYLPLAGWIMAFQNFKLKTGLLHSKFVGKI